MARPRLNTKQENTIKRMKENRVNDGIKLRKTIEDKLAWAKVEKEKGLQVIEKQLTQVKENQQILMKLSAVIDVLTDLLAEKEATEEAKKE